MRGLAFFAVNGVLVWSSARVARALFPDGPRPMRVLATALLAVVGLVTCLEYCGAVGLLAWWPVCAVLLAASIGAAVVVRVRTGAEAPSLAEPTPGRDGWRTLTALGAAAAGLLYFGYVLTRVRLDADCTFYHLPVAASFVQTGSLAPTDAPCWFYPSGGELVTAWLMMPWHADWLMVLANVPALSLLAIALYAVLTTIGVRGSLALLLVGTIGCWRVIRLLSTTQKVDVLFAAAILSLVAFLLDLAARQGKASLLLAALAMGLACAVKHTGLLYACLFLVCLMVLHRQVRAACGSVRAAVAMVLVPIAVVGAPCYVRNWILTGSPVWPMGLSVFGVTVFAGQPSSQSAVGSMFVSRLASAEAWGLLARSVWHWTRGAPLAALPLAAGALWFGLPRQEGAVRAVLIAFTLGSAAVFLVTPLTVENIPGTMNLLRTQPSAVRLALAFWVLPVVWAGAALERLARRRWARHLLHGGLLWLVYAGLKSTLRHGRAEAAFLIAVAAAIGLYWAWARLVERRALRRVGLAVAGLAVAVAFLVAQGGRYVRWPADRLALFEAKNVLPDVGGEAGEERPPALYRWFAGHVHGQRVGAVVTRCYFYYGPALENRVVVLPRELDGRDLRALAAELDWVVTTVISTDRSDPLFATWPPAAAALDAHPELFELVFHEPVARVYRCQPPSSGGETGRRGATSTTRRRTRHSPGSGAGLAPPFDFSRDGLEALHWHRQKAGTIEHTHDVLKSDLAAGPLQPYLRRSTCIARPLGIAWAKPGTRTRPRPEW